MPSEAYQRFLDSMVMDYEKWHDGIGYDLDALAAVSVDERTELEAKLIARRPRDWRDIEALAALRTPAAIEAIQGAKQDPDPAIRARSLETLTDLAPESVPDLEAEIVRAVEGGALDLAEKHPTPRVKRALLDCARLSDATTRVNAAAMLMYLCGKADVPFDWNQRDFFLRFGTEDNQELRKAWTELRERTGV